MIKLEVMSRTTQLLRRLRRDRRGSTAIEFAIVSVPFLIFAFGIMTVGLQFFTINSLEHAVEAAAREIRTGQAQSAGMKMKDFKESICDHAVGYISCDSNLVVHVQSAGDWAGINPTPCVTGNALTPAAGNENDDLSTYSGTQGMAVLVTACFKWTLGQELWGAIYNLFTIWPGALGPAEQNGPAIIVVQAATTFKTEPYGS